LQAAAISINQQTTDSARKKADAIVAAAEAESRQIAAETQASIEAQLNKAQADLAAVIAERDSVEVYLRNLKEFLESSKLLGKPSNLTN
ncbi:MAG: hypothetical protein RL716_1111, partial [Actinomycetota bacterium]